MLGLGVLGASSLCIVPTLQVCARITGYSGFDHQDPVPGVCVTFNDTGVWQVRPPTGRGRVGRGGCMFVCM
jgi:hypothetical protein